MFKKEYQGGPHVEVFSAQGRDPVAKWKLLGPVKREFHRSVKGYVYTMEGSSSTSTRMQLPKNEKAQLGLVQPYCVFQLLVPSDARFTIDLSVVDGGGSKRRIQLSTSLREPSTSPLNARVPLTAMLTGQWLNLCVDMESLVSGLFRGQVFKSLEGVSLGGHCMVRRIFTLHASPPDTVSGQKGVEEIPKAYQMPVAAGVIQTQVLTYASVSGVQAPSDSTLECPSPPSSRTADTRPTHVAFGSKVTIPDHILHCRQSSRSASSVGSETTVRGKSGGVATSLQTVYTRQSSAERRGAGTVDGQGIQPHPPNHPADPSMLRIQRKRVRMIGGGGRRKDGEHREAERKHQSEVVDSVSSQSMDSLAPGSERVTTTMMEVSDSDSGYRTSEQLVQWPGEVSSGDMRLMTAQQDTSLVLEEEEGEEEEEEEEEEGEEEEEEEVEEETSGYLDASTEGAHAVAGGLHSSILSSESSVDLATSEEDALYLYHSPPKSAGRRHANLTSPVESASSRRGARLDEDFVSPSANEPGEEGSPHSGVGVVSDVHQLTESRLSDDYDWRQYASVDGGDLAHDRSLHSRLTNAPHPIHTLPLPTTTATTHSNSSEMESTLSGSMTLSGWTERFKDAARGPILDSLDTRGMGGTLSPAMETLTDQSDLEMEGVWQEGGEEEEVELMYDPQLNCFYDPHTCKYYELVQ